MHESDIKTKCQANYDDYYCGISGYELPIRHNILSDVLRAAFALESHCLVFVVALAVTAWLAIKDVPFWLPYATIAVVCVCAATAHRKGRNATTNKHRKKGAIELGNPRAGQSDSNVFER